MPFSQSYAFMTQMSSVWPTGTSVTDFSAVSKRRKVVWIGGWYPFIHVRPPTVLVHSKISFHIARTPPGPATPLPTSAAPALIGVTNRLLTNWRPEVELGRLLSQISVVHVCVVEQSSDVDKLGEGQLGRLVSLGGWIGV